VAYDANVWRQLKNTTVEQFIAALKKDGWTDEEKGGGRRCFVKGSLRVVVHYHPGKTWGAKFLKGLLDDTRWTLDDLRRLKFIK
jgi:predicted RNA binding protein YcfA (HicA-like mRNA interferase family)